MTLTTTDLDRLEALERAATAAPWPDDAIYAILKFVDRNAYTPAWEDEEGNAWDYDRHVDAPLITAARNTLPALIAALREARALLAAVVRRPSPDEYEDNEFGRQICWYCEASLGQWGYVECKGEHKPDCPYELARAHLAAAGVEVG